MNKASLKKLSKSELIKLLLKQEKKKPKIIVVDDTKPVPASRTYKPRPPVPTPRKSVKQMAKEYEENIILPPPEFRDDYKFQHQEPKNQWINQFQHQEPKN